MILGFTEWFIFLVLLSKLIEWLVIGGGIVVIGWLIYKAGKVGMFDAKN